MLVGLRRRFGVLSEPNVKPLAIATLFNAGGNNVYSVALGVLAYDITGSPLAVGAVLGLRTVPIVFMGLVSGAVNDRMHRPTVLRLYALWYTGLSFGFTLLLYTVDVSIPHMLAYMFLVGLGFTFGPSARRAIYADSVPRNRVVDALAIDGTMFSLGHMTMPAIIGVIIEIWGAGVAFAVQTCLYTAMTTLAFRVTTPRRVVDMASRPSFVRSVGEGVSYARRRPGVLRMLLVSSSLTVFGGSFAYTLVPVVSGSLLDAGAIGVGAIFAGGAAGGVLGPVTLLFLRGRMGSPAVLALSIFVMCAGLAAFALAPTLLLAVIPYAVIGASEPIQKATSDGYMQLAVEDNFRGRIGSLNQMSRGLSSFGAFFAGAMAELIGVQYAILAAATVVAFIGVWSIAAFRKYGVDGW